MYRRGCEVGRGHGVGWVVEGVGVGDISYMAGWRVKDVNAS